jgi:P-type Cu+ transporter
VPPSSSHGPDRDFPHTPTHELHVVDVVCGMSVPVRDETQHTSYGAHTYYFCSRRCLRLFEDEPQRYAAADSEEPRPDAPKDPVCGMSVDIRADTPHTDHAGRTLYFCSEQCRHAFRHRPGDFTVAVLG